MKYGQLRMHDVANGKGIRTTLFVSGCIFDCEDCFNKDLQDFNYGFEFTKETLNKIIKNSKQSHIDGLSILGGEPFNFINTLIPIVKMFKNQTGKNVWIWSGFTYDQILKLNNGKKLLKYVDVLVDGRFEKDKKDLSLKYRGSVNQRVIELDDNGDIISINSFI